MRVVLFFLMSLSFALASTNSISTTIVPSTVWTDPSGFSKKSYFLYDDGVHGLEIWVTDGTALGTKLVDDLQTGSDTSISVSYANVVNDRLVFFWNEKAQWYTTDGTASGTVVLTDAQGSSL